MFTLLCRGVCLACDGFSERSCGRPTRGLLGSFVLDFLLATFFLVSQAIDLGAFFPILSATEALTFFAWCVAFVYLVFLARIQAESFGLVLTPVLSFMMLGAVLAFPVHPESVPEFQLQMNPYFKAHIMSAFFAYASFTLFLCGKRSLSDSTT